MNLAKWTVRRLPAALEEETVGHAHDVGLVDSRDGVSSIGHSILECILSYSPALNINKHELIAVHICISGTVRYWWYGRMMTQDWRPVPDYAMAWFHDNVTKCDDCAQCAAALRSQNYLFSAPALTFISAPATAPATAIYWHFKLF